MPDLPSPAAGRLRPPSWLDGRLALGVLLVLVSVIAGARLVASADRSVRVWAAADRLAAGTTLTPGDLRSVRVRLYDEPGRYLRAEAPLAGRTLARDVGAGELVPADALGEDPAGRLVSLPVGRLHAPRDLRRGQRVDVYATVKPPGAAARTERVLADAAVQGVRQSGGGLTGSGAELAVYVRVPPEAAAAVVQAVQGAQLDVVGVLGPAGRGVDAVAGGPPTPTR